MNQADENRKETQRIRIYRALLRPQGITNGECMGAPLHLGSTYRTRISELRIDMARAYGAEVPDWIPGEEIQRTEEICVWRWRLIVPAGARDQQDPLGLLPEREALREAQKKVLTAPTTGAHNQATLF